MNTVAIKYIGAVLDFLGKILTSPHGYEQDKH